MKISNECARKILIEIEKIPYGETLVVWKLQEAMPEFAIEDILAIVTAFNREHYITVLDKVSYDDNDVFRDHKIKCLTEKGYRTLDLIRDDELWEAMCKKMENANLSFYTMLDIANRINTARQNKAFNIPETLVSNNNRW